MKRILIIDALNCFSRAYAISPAVSPGGEFIGGIIGFLKILQKSIKHTNPDMIIVCWDSQSKRKKNYDKNYKENRSKRFSKLNRNIDFLSEDQRRENYNYQRSRLVEYFNNLPIIQFWFQDIEADEIIGFLCRSPYLAGDQKIIVSGDKDFFQLCDKETIIYNSGESKFRTIKTIIQDYEIHPKNFALAKSICGDPSDNLKGVGGVGFKTLIKHFPFLKEDYDYTIQDILEEASKKMLESNLKVFKSIVENEKAIHSNYRIIQLYSVILPSENAETIKETLSGFNPIFLKTDFLKMLMHDGLDGTNWDELFSSCRRICSGL